MNRNDPTVAEDLKILIPQLESRQAALREKLEALADGARAWEIDIDVAIGDVRTILDAMMPDALSTEEEDEVS